MPSVKVHCAISKKRTGNEFAELHEWIDKSKIPGPDHRVKRHYYNVKDRNQIKKHWESKKKGWGEKAMIEWLFHIAIDNLDTAYKMSRQSFSYGKNTFNLMQFGFSKTGYIHCNFDTVDEHEFKFKFDD